MPRYIDADALIEDIKRVYCTDCNSYNGVRCKACGTGDAIDMIEDAPAVDAAQERTAYWVVVQSRNPTSVTVHRCSNPECRLTTYAHRLPPYCQECGSKMLGKAREEDDKYILQST